MGIKRRELLKPIKFSNKGCDAEDAEENKSHTDKQSNQSLKLQVFDSSTIFSGNLPVSQTCYIPERNPLSDSHKITFDIRKVNSHFHHSFFGKVDNRADGDHGIDQISNQHCHKDEEHKTNSTKRI